MWVIDFESSGLSKRSYPIEVAISNGKLEYSSLILPLPHWTYWNSQAQTVHNISRRDLINIGRSPKLVAKDLNNLIQGKKAYCDSINWDSFWLNVLFSDSAIRPTFEITDIQDILDTSTKLQAFLLKRQELINSNCFTLHRALEDVRIIHLSLSETMGI